ncbi:MAG: DUF4404 family protein [Anaerolineales bacterium]|jgi:predicted component of type VI protein secretion system|uniref:DUF4404 family protein n=1 Tax=Candidatus Villigracilis affinis TaxID=3140682 RepID=UPI001B663EDE|nr:DUF4404 family protein [Anaerolineales bacterium]MBK9603473.1 DUF4404 family protein [Anaerolineales bacterium]MBL0346626.1 DUF4404 family protein [Anaerolineales bacterium]MBP8047296.1 DUF4404 family protein [Anaerolineales bacterium]
MMENKELEKLLEKLHAELEKVDSVDEEGMQLLRGIEQDINELLNQTDRDTMLGRLREAIQQFEVSHPTLTAMLSEISSILNIAGI